MKHVSVFLWAAWKARGVMARAGPNRIGLRPQLQVVLRTRLVSVAVVLWLLPLKAESTEISVPY